MTSFRSTSTLPTLDKSSENYSVKWEATHSPPFGKCFANRSPATKTSKKNISSDPSNAERRRIENHAKLIQLIEKLQIFSDGNGIKLSLLAFSLRRARPLSHGYGEEKRKIYIFMLQTTSKPRVALFFSTWSWKCLFLLSPFRSMRMGEERREEEEGGCRGARQSGSSFLLSPFSARQRCSARCYAIQQSALFSSSSRPDSDSALAVPPKPLIRIESLFQSALIIVFVCSDGGARAGTSNPKIL